MQRYKKIYEYNDTVIFNPQDASINGVGIHTRFPIIKKERILYDSHANGSVAYYLKVNKDTIIVINNHLEGTHLSNEDRNKYKQIIAGKKRTRQHAGHKIHQHHDHHDRCGEEQQNQ